MELKVEQVMQVIATRDVAVGPKYVSFRDPDAEENSSRWRLSYEDRGKRKSWTLLEAVQISVSRVVSAADRIQRFVVFYLFFLNVRLFLIYSLCEFPQK
jgi:hypothetical protein